MTAGHDPFDALQGRTPAQLLAELAVYGFRDPLGHPLVMCAEFLELRGRFAGAPFTDEPEAA